ncbi:MAG TPA: AsmA-like C-terminal region-containing protein [Bacteroidales bacterium]|nr:AsmA-like C-terminal region-containing protein [Bacteroidales bacterium]
MKKILKILLITLLSLITIVIITVSISLWLIFTPEKLTPIVHKQADKLISCQTEIGEIELTLFSTFPNFGIKIKDFSIINPFTGAQSDTLVDLDEITGIVDAKAWWKNNEIILIGLELQGGSVNVFSDSLGKCNYDIFLTDTTAVQKSSEPESETINPVIDIRNIALKNIDISYIDLSSKIHSEIKDIDVKITGIVNADSISGEINIKSPSVSFSYDGEKYLETTSVDLDIPADFLPSHQILRLKNAAVSLNSMELLLDGLVENDTVNKNIITDISYKLESWPVRSIVALVPPSFTSYLKGVDADGILSSQGTIKGILNDSVMPVMDIRLQIENGALKYADFPLPLHDIKGNFTIYTDLKNDAISYLNISNFAAKTPASSVNITGKVTRLFSDIHCNLVTTAGLNLKEFMEMIPDSMDLHVRGKVDGKIRTIFSVSQFEKMQIEKMKLSGSLRLSEFYADYDSLEIKTDKSDIEFELPNLKAETKSTKFAFARIEADNFMAGKPGTYNASMGNATITFETSDARDTTRIPDLLCSFSMDTLSAGTDTISVAISKPFGKLEVSPASENPDQLHINLSYSSNHLLTVAGESSVDVKSININSDIINDNKQKDIFQQWMAKGSLDMNGGTINVAGLYYPVEIPTVKMNFEPEIFSIMESSFKVGNSDFQLKGNLINILSYFRNDSILRGDFSFISNTTDVDQLMALTNGLGQPDSAKADTPEIQNADTSYTGPYMVPKGIDLFLTTNIKKVTMGIDTATNIIGNVQVHDGILVLDGLSFKTPAARMQLTAMYRTPRKNHLYLGLDYHMLDVEIEKLLSMIPDIDTLMPMLRSFRGKGEFHIAVETYLDSMYNLKKSTLRGASSIRGNNLVLMDGETFSEIAKSLRFSKHAKNNVDSLSAEFTIFRNEIDIYPFLIVMDRYKAVIAGRHNFDMSFDYHISVVDCPLPIKLGVDVKGTEEALKYNLAKCRYAEFYRPTSRKAVENKQLELRQMIRDALTSKVSQ